MALSYNEVVAGTGQTLVTLTFPFLDRTHVKVSVDRVDLPGSAWTWVSDASIQLNEALVGGETLRAYRETPAAGVQADFQPGAFDYEELNTSLSHLLYIVQEAYDNAVAAVEAGHSAFAYLVQIEELADEIGLIFSDIQAIQTSLTGHSAETIATVNGLLANTASLHAETLAFRDAAFNYRGQAQVEATRSQDQAGIATTKATEASTSASHAAARKSEVDGLKIAVEGLESAAATSAMTATNAMSAVQVLYDNFMSAYDNFNDRYLGSKASPPTTDNDGQPLIGGALYFDTSAGAMKVWDGAAWRAAYVSFEGNPLLVSNNLGDLTNVPQARINLGLGSVDNTPDAAKPISTATQAALTALSGDVGGRASKSANLSDLANAAAARSNLGLAWTGMGSMVDFRGSSYQTEPPSTFYGKGELAGFASGGTLGVPGHAASDYGVLHISAHYQDASGLPAIQQTFSSAKGVVRRVAASGTAWGSWLQMAHIIVSSAAPSGPTVPGEIWVQV